MAKQKLRKNSFVEGTLIATVAIIITKIMGMLYVIPFYAMVGVTGSALYAYAYNIYNIFLDISSAGLPIAVSKIINEYNTLGMMDAKQRAFRIGKKIMVFLAVIVFVVLFVFSKDIAHLLIGELEGGNTIEDVSLAIKSVSFAILIVPFLSVTKGYLQGHKILNVPSISQVIEQIVRITIILLGSYFIIYVMNESESLAVDLSVFGAFVSGVAAYAYIKLKMRHSDLDELDLNKEYPKDKITNKDITKKIISYAVPFVIISIAASIYSFTDMTLILRTMDYLGFSVIDTEFITSAATTYAPKINMIITSFAIGMSASLIPTMVSAYTLKDWDEVNSKFNQAFQIIMLISLPLTVGISLLSASIWSIFYGYNAIGTKILSLAIVTGFVSNFYMTVENSLQGLNKFKLVYLTTILGLALNLCLDVPLMLLFNKIGLPPYLGATTASIIGYSVSVIIAMIKLRKECNMHYGKTFNVTLKIILATLIMGIIVFVSKTFIPVNYDSRLSCILYLMINGIIGALVFTLIGIKLHIFKDVLGTRQINRLLKIITFGKYKKGEENAS